jgi:ABC-2 type transport system permease protein
MSEEMLERTSSTPFFKRVAANESVDVCIYAQRCDMIGPSFVQTVGSGSVSCLLSLGQYDAGGGIGVWGLAAYGLWSIGSDAIIASSGFDIARLPAPAVGWPLFIALGVIYFAMAYLLLGALFLTIGAMANTVREVQTLSMPVTMMQLMVFFLAAYTIKQPGSGLELAAIVFPLSSPFAMLARAAMEPQLWTHALALAWQGLAVLALVKGGAVLFRKRVMKSGGAGRARRPGGRASWLARRTSGTAEPAE